jgi:hypothetical protein
MGKQETLPLRVERRSRQKPILSTLCPTKFLSTLRMAHRYHVNTSLPPDVELGAGWYACIGSLGRPAAQDGIKQLMARGFHKPGDAEDRLGYYLGQIAR